MAEQTAPSGKRARRGGGLLDNLSPDQIESVAKWILAMSSSYPEMIRKGEEWLKQHPEDYSQKRQNQYWENYISVSKHLAYLARKEQARIEKQQG